MRPLRGATNEFGADWSKRKTAWRESRKEFRSECENIQCENIQGEQKNSWHLLCSITIVIFLCE